MVAEIKYILQKAMFKISIHNALNYNKKNYFGFFFFFYSSNPQNLPVGLYGNNFSIEEGHHIYVIF